MAEWFEALPLLERVFFFIALPSTIILLIQTVMLFFGGVDDGSMFTDTSGFDSSIDFSTNDALHSDLNNVSGSVTGGDLSFITIRGVVAFLTVTGWTGVICVEMGVPGTVSIIVSVLLGVCALIGVAYLIRALLSLQSVKYINYKAAIGLTGAVYLPIPADAGGTGKVSLTFGGTYKQYDAVTNQDRVIKTGESVRVVDITRGNVMVVESE